MLLCTITLLFCIPIGVLCFILSSENHVLHILYQIYLLKQEKKLSSVIILVVIHDIGTSDFSSFFLQLEIRKSVICHLLRFMIVVKEVQAFHQRYMKLANSVQNLLSHLKGMLLYFYSQFEKWEQSHSVTNYLSPLFYMEPELQEIFYIKILLFYQSPRIILHDSTQAENCAVF